MKAHKWLLLFHDHLYCLDDQCAAGDVLPSARKIRIRGSEFKFFVSYFRKLEEIIIKNREQWRQPLKIVRFFLPTISHTCGRIKPPWRAAINRNADFLKKRIEINLIRLINLWKTKLQIIPQVLGRHMVHNILYNHAKNGEKLYIKKKTAQQQLWICQRLLIL